MSIHQKNVDRIVKEAILLQEEKEKEMLSKIITSNQEATDKLINDILNQD